MIRALVKIFKWSLEKLKNFTNEVIMYKLMTKILCYKSHFSSPKCARLRIRGSFTFLMVRPLTDSVLFLGLTMNSINSSGKIEVVA